MIEPAYHSHYFKCNTYEYGIARGLCSCGVVRYFPSCIGQEYIERASVLNKQEEKRMGTSTECNGGIPPKPGLGSRNARRLMKYYDDNREAILRDLKTMGQTATVKKWGISPSGWVNILKRWERQEKGVLSLKESGNSQSDRSLSPADKHAPASAEAKQPGPLGIMPGHLPELPSFDSQWPNEIKVKWFDAFTELARRQQIVA